MKLYRAGDYWQYFPGGVDSSIKDNSVVNGYAESFMTMDYLAFGITRQEIRDSILMNSLVTSKNNTSVTIASRQRVGGHVEFDDNGCWTAPLGTGSACSVINCSL